ncbi:MAG: hypothetical protein HY907_03005 [Deltaproteobacteria bacterium]|nr:hypothetical protein [Deltaproteobacteria bacterium]
MSIATWVVLGAWAATVATGCRGKVAAQGGAESATARVTDAATGDLAPSPEAGETTVGRGPDRADGAAEGDVVPPAAEAGVAEVAEPPGWPTSEPCRQSARKVFADYAKPMSVAPTPPGPVPGLTTTTALAMDEGWNTCVVTPEGAAVCWGATIGGLLREDPENHDIPVADPENRGRPMLVAGFAGLVSILPSGAPHACGLRGDGTVGCFGLNRDGQLGRPAFEPTWSDVPLAIEGLPAVLSLAVGHAFACALVEGGGVLCWGRNESGQLGDGTRASRPTPAAVPGLGGAKAIAAGREQACALLSDGTVRCWGDMLATRCLDPFVSPTPVPELAGVIELSVGWDLGCAVLGGGGVRCWGDGEGGQLGNGELARSFLPVAVAGIEDAAAVEAGDGVACALRRDGTVACWGKNQCGQVDGGASGKVYVAEPAAVPGVSDVVELAVGGMQTCARRKDGAVLCWGATTPPQFSACLLAW